MKIGDLVVIRSARARKKLLKKFPLPNIFESIKCQINFDKSLWINKKCLNASNQMPSEIK